MTDEIINQAIESTPVETQPVESSTENTEENKATEETTTPEPSEPEDVPFPKKAVNALSRRDKQIGKLQAQLAAERAELAKYREQQAKTPKDNAPDENAFDNYGEYLKAVARYEAKQELSQTSKQQKEAESAAQEEAWISERSAYASERAVKAVETIPDYKQLFMENADVLQSLPPHVERAFLEADAPELAFYALAKEGRLEALLNMSPSKAAIEIGRAELRGEALSKAKPVTRAPAPVAGVKGASGTTKTLDTMNSSELMKWFNQR